MDPIYIGPMITLAINLATMAYLVGKIFTRIDNLERNIIKLEIDVREMRSFPVELATIRTELSNLVSVIGKLEAAITKNDGAHQ